jgi:hypothetical protein
MSMVWLCLDALFIGGTTKHNLDVNTLKPQDSEAGRREERMTAAEEAMAEEALDRRRGVSFSPAPTSSATSQRGHSPSRRV